MPRIVTRKEQKAKKMRFQVAAGMFDFLAILTGIVAIVVCIVLLMSLYKWVVTDVSTSFKSLWGIFTSAIIIPE